MVIRRTSFNIQWLIYYSKALINRSFSHCLILLLSPTMPFTMQSIVLVIWLNLWCYRGRQVFVYAFSGYILSTYADSPVIYGQGTWTCMKSTRSNAFANRLHIYISFEHSVHAYVIQFIAFVMNKAVKKIFFF